MPLRANYEIIAFDEHLGNNDNDIPIERLKQSRTGFIYDDYAFVGAQSTLRSFTIDSRPRGGGYLTIQLFDVNKKGHRIEINGIELSKESIIGTEVRSNHSFIWQSWTTDFKTSILKQGNNDVRIFKAANSDDNFLVGTLIINWREES